MSWKSFLNESHKRQEDAMANAFGFNSDAQYQNQLDERPGIFQSLINKYTGAGLTREQVMNNDYQEYLSNTAYQRQVADMQAAGVNPALAMSKGSGASTPTASTGSNGGNFADLVSMLMLPSQLKQIDANIESAKSQAEVNRAHAANIAQDTKNKEVSEQQMRLNLQFDKDLYNIRKESYELSNSKQQIEIDVLKEKKNEIIANVSEIAARTKNEEYKGWLIQAETKLRQAEEYQIRAMIPFEQALKSAKTAQARAAASLSTVQAATQQKLLDAGYVDREIRNMDAEYKKILNDTQYAQVHTDLLRIQRDIQEGRAIDTDSIPDWHFTDKLAAEVWNNFIERMFEASQAITGPIAGILK